MKYPNIIFFRLEKYEDIDKFIDKNKDYFDCSFNITDKVDNLNNLYNNNFHLLVTYGEDENEYNFINKYLAKRFCDKWIHKKDISNIKKFNYNINYCYIHNCLEKREKTRPIFSIFTTCYNSYDKINRALKSILSQTLNDWEWVILDDSPDENHFKFLKDTLKDNRIRIYSRDKNSGNIGNVKNEVIGLCRGKYILELDHDDEITENVLQESVNIFEKDNEIGFIYWDFINIHENGNNYFYSDFISLGYGGYYTQKLNNKWVNVYITPNINNITTSYLVSMPNHPRIWKRSVLNKLEDYSEYLPICDDFDILLRTCINTKIVKVCDIGYIQYMNENNNNFSLIRNHEINRIGPKYISPIFFEKYNVHEKMKELNSYEDKNYINNHSQIWKRKNYKHKFMNYRINNNYEKIYCVLGHNNINKIKDINNNPKNDIILLDNCLDIEELQNMLDQANLDRVKCYVLRDCNEYELIKFFNLMYKYTENYEIIVNNFSSRDNLINTLIFKNNYKDYLEIGIEDGFTFQEIEVENKIGIDPSPQYNDNNIIISTSDDFFENNIKNFDCIFIDGMHQSDYVLKDLNNSINFLNDNGTIIIDDIIPLTEQEQYEKPLNFYYKDNILKSKCFWTGDVWKVIYELLLNYYDFIKEFNYYEHNNYRGIFTFKLKEKFTITKINNYSYDDDFKNYLLLLKSNNIITPQKICTNNFFNNIDFNYLIIDNFLNKDLLENSLNKIKQYTNDKWKKAIINNNVQINNYYIDEINNFDKFTTQISNYFSSEIFINWLSNVTNIPDLEWDKDLTGGGIHKTTKNGKLDIHSDFNINIKTNKYRRVNILLYLNKNWIKENNGELELWNEDMNKCITSIEPIFNRMVILKINDDANHGHPKKWNSEEDRLSFAFYYYTNNRPEHEKSETYFAQWKNIIEYKQKKILFVSISDRPILSERIFNQLKKYCSKHNYDYEIIDYSMDKSRHIAWTKILLMKKLMIEKEYDYYIWIDDDIYITNLDITIESIIDKYDFENILISDDPFEGNTYSINSGIFICKKNNKVLKYFDDIYKLGDEIYCEIWENSAMDHHHKHVDNNFITIIDTNILQSHYRDWCITPEQLWKKEHFSAHLCGMSLTNRIKYLDSLEDVLYQNGNYLMPIKYENKNIIIIDNFYNDIDDVRQMALNQEFNVKGNYPGIRTKSFATENIKSMFEKYIGKKIIYWPDEYNGSYQYTTKDMDSWVHRDPTNWAGIIYLTPNAPLAAGTAFFKHKKTGIENLEEYNNSTKEIQKELDNDGQDMDKWDMIDYVGNKYNRLVLFQGCRNHRSMEYFGDNKENGRLFQTWFFDAE